MREIIFRGKCRIDDEWIYGSLNVFNVEVEILDMNTVDNSCYPVDPQTVGQYTGLTDKNSVKIFEGDIVIWGHANEYSRENPIRKAIVKIAPDLIFMTFTKTEFGCPHNFHFGNFAYKDTNRHIEVIGNIHDNPEIINE